MEFVSVTAIAKANVYFEGKVVSHTILMPDGSKKTLGIIYPGSYHFGTAAAELMEVTEGVCSVILDGDTASKTYQAGESFSIQANSGFSITVESDICQYVCSFFS